MKHTVQRIGAGLPAVYSVVDELLVRSVALRPRPPAGVPTVLVGTHHKMGTVWMYQVFRRVAGLTGRRFIDMSDCTETSEAWDRVLGRAARGRPAICFHYESRFPSGLDPDRCRGLHLVRDPRDVLVSATRYHMRAREDWLFRRHRPTDNAGYQTCLNALATAAEQQRFELERATGRVLEQAIQFDLGAAFRTGRYEDLVGDSQFRHWRGIGHHLGFRGRDLGRFLRGVHDRSLFGGLEPGRRHRRHLRAGGRPGRWRRELTPEALEALEHRFGEAWRRLGYE